MRSSEETLTQSPSVESKCVDADGVSAKDICVFLCEYASTLLGSGATCIRVERNVGRMATALGCKAVMTVLPRHIHLTVSRHGCAESYTYMCDTAHGPISFDVNTRLSRLSWAFADGEVDFEGARERFSEILHTPVAAPLWVLFAASCANAAFCRLFNGDMYAVGVVFLSTLAGFYVRQLLCGRKVDIRLVVILCAFISSVLAAGASLFHIGDTPEIAVATSVLYLVPGIPFLNSFSDLLSGNYICCYCRFVQAVILTCCLSVGLCCGLFLMNMGMF